jgi:hypothetical protein
MNGIPSAFHAFNAQHIITLLAISIAGVLVVWVAEKGTSPQRKWLRVILAFLLSGYVARLYILQGIHHALAHPDSAFRWWLIRPAI